MIFFGADVTACIIHAVCMIHMCAYKCVCLLRVCVFFFQFFSRIKKKKKLKRKKKCSAVSSFLSMWPTSADVPEYTERCRLTSKTDAMTTHTTQRNSASASVIRRSTFSDALYMVLFTTRLASTNCLHRVLSPVPLPVCLPLPRCYRLLHRSFSEQLPGHRDTVCRIARHRRPHGEKI